MRPIITGHAGLARRVEVQLARATTLTVRQGTEALKQDLRAETQAAFKGNRLPMAWRSRVYPAGQDSLDAAGWVEVRRTAARIIEPAFTGAVIRAKGGRWLAIPTANAGTYGLKRGAAFGATVNTRGMKERTTPGGFERRTGLKLRFVYERSGGSSRRAFLVVDQAQLNRGVAGPYRGRGRGSKLYGPSGQTFVVFILVPQVTAKKRLDRAAIMAAASARTPGLIANFWKD